MNILLYKFDDLPHRQKSLCATWSQVSTVDKSASILESIGDTIFSKISMMNAISSSLGTGDGTFNSHCHWQQLKYPYHAIQFSHLELHTSYPNEGRGSSRILNFNLKNA